MEKRPLPFIRVILIILVIFIVGLLGYYLVRTKQELNRLKNNSSQVQDAARAEVKALVEKIGMFVQLPTDEDPTVATVSDPEKLRTQPFFVQAEAGDKVLIYTNAKKAILYRPSTNKIINIAPISLGQSSSPSAQLQEQFTVILLNGTATTGLTKKYEALLKQKVSNASVIDRDNAKKQTYEKTVLIDLVGTEKDRALSIAQVLGIEVSLLPSGEVAPTGADFLIIVGSDVQ